jgi:hypothetical protein
MVKKAIFAFDRRDFSSRVVFSDLRLSDCPSLHFYFYTNISVIFFFDVLCLKPHGNDLKFNMMEGIVTEFTSELLHGEGPGVAQWLRRCTTSRTVLGSIPGGVTGFFSDIFLPTQPLVKMSTRNIFWG